MQRWKACWGKCAARVRSSNPVLFIVNNRFRTTDWLLLVAVCAFFFFWKLSSFGLIGADEPRYAQVAREMLARHDFVTPTLSGTAWLEKPTLYYWQAIAAYRVFGVSDWAARLPSACDALLLVLAIYWFFRGFRPGIELDAALMLATAAGIVGYARAASMDMALGAMFTIALLAWFAWLETEKRGYLAAFYGFLALAMLAKGPVAPFLAAVIIATFAVLHGSVRIAWKTLWVPGIALFCAIGLPWCVAVQVRNPQFFRVFILEHNLARFGTNLYHHPEPFWYYVPVSLLGWVPWSGFVIAALITTARQIRKADSDLLHAFLVVWILVFVVFFSISQSKLPGYVLPAIPAGVALAAQYLRVKMSERPALVIGATHAVLSAFVLVASMSVRDIMIHHLAWSRGLAIPVAVVAFYAVLTAVLLQRFGYRVLRVTTLVPVVVALALALRSGSQMLDNSLSARPVANALAQYDPHHLPIAVFLVPRETEFGLQFYRDQTVSRYELGQIPAGEHLVVAARGFQKGVAKASGRNPIYLGDFTQQKLEYFYVPAR
jgi:4-amino-4-deoxy-L-arabinose transferase-like glycosyltransferase